MSLSIYTAHAGGVLKADGNTFVTTEELRKWIEQKTRLQSSCQILMTSRGTNARPSILSNEKELFLYDRKQLEPSSKPFIDTVPPLHTIPPFPDDLESETDMSSWRLLFKKRKQWAEQVSAHAHGLAKKIREAEASVAVMRRSVNVAFINLETHSVGLDGSLAKLRAWADGVMQDRDKVLATWEPTVKKLLRMPVHEEFKSYGGGEKGSKKVNVLAGFFDIKEVQTAAVTLGILAERFEKDVKQLGITIEDISSRTVNLKAAIQQNESELSMNVEEQLNSLLEEVDVLVNKIRTDNEYARGLMGPKSASAASKRAYASTTDYLPGLMTVTMDINKFYITTIERKNATSAACHEHLQHIAGIQSVAAPVNPQISKLDAAYEEDSNQFQLLSLVLRLPKSYGSLLVECIRRREWSEKFSSNSAKLAEDLALMKDDEEKRRRRWQRCTGSSLPFELDDASQVIRAELSTRGDVGGGLPKITRQDIEDYISTLVSIGGMDDVVKELQQSLQEIDKPSRRAKHLRGGFKMGSIHEANITDSSMLGRNDELKILRADKEQLSERIKGYESRIRKLEDLLHRRTANGNMYPNSTTPTPSTPITQQSFPLNIQIPPPPPHPQVDQLPSPGNPPIPARTSSSEATSVAEQLKSRIAALEVELSTEKQKALRLQQEASKNTASEKEMNTRIAQADETKKDLVANLEATVQQHTIERKALTSEIDDLKQKLEEVYEELDRVEEEKVKNLESELEILGGELAHIRQLHEHEAGNNKNLSMELKLVQEERAKEIAGLQSELENQVKLTEEERRRVRLTEVAMKESELAATEKTFQLEKDLNDARAALDIDRTNHSSSYESLLTSMIQAYSHLSSDPPPENINALTARITAMVSELVSSKEGLMAMIEAEREKSAHVKEDRDFLQSRFDSRTLRAKDLTQRLYTHNVRSIQLLESLGYRIVRSEDSMQIVKIPRSNPNESTTMTKSATINNLPTKSSPLSLAESSTVEDINLLYWMESPDSDAESEKYSQYLKTIGAFDLDAFSETVINRVKKAEQDARQLMKQGRAYREKYYRARDEASEKIAFKSFKHGDLALFLPTRNQATRPWAAFNVGAPHFFLREQDTHKLSARDWLLARITKVEERVVDLSRSTASINVPHGLERSSVGGSSDGGTSFDDENPFELSDGLRWYLLDAVEEKSGAPSTPGLSSSTVAAANVDAKGSLKSRKPITGAKKKLSEITTEHSRRSSVSSNRNSALISTETAAALFRVTSTDSVMVGGVGGVGATVLPGAGENVVIESVPISSGAPRTPVEKIVAGVRSRASSIRSRTPAATDR